MQTTVLPVVRDVAQGQHNLLLLPIFEVYIKTIICNQMDFCGRSKPLSYGVVDRAYLLKYGCNQNMLSDTQGRFT